MRNDFESNYLAHHGILGMKWGKKNGPPYPLGASDHSASEKKAGWRKSLDSRRAYKQTKRIIGKTKPYESYKALNSKNSSRITEMVNRNITDEQRSRLKELSDEHKKLASKTKSGHSEKADAAFRAYNEETKKVTREILGKYGDKKLNSLSLDETAYRDIVQQATKWAKILDGQSGNKETSKDSSAYDKLQKSKELNDARDKAFTKFANKGAELIRNNSELKKGFVDISQVDDFEFLVQVANETYSTKSKDLAEFNKLYEGYLDARDESRRFDRDNKKEIAKAKKGK